MDGFFITGTDTNVGKTIFSSCLALGFGADYWKPIQSGLKNTTDSERVANIIGTERVLPESYRLSEPLSPNHSAEIDGVHICLDNIKIPNTLNNYIVVEGAGGILVPINSNSYMVDLIKRLNFPAIIVARSSLGTLNHTLLTIRELRRKNIEILGVVLNGEKNLKNKKTIEELGQVQILLEMEPTKEINSEFLIDQFKRMDLRAKYFKPNFEI